MEYNACDYSREYMIHSTVICFCYIRRYVGYIFSIEL